MATTIIFAAPRADRSLAVRVEEEPDKVLELWTAAKGMPLALTDARDLVDKVWINPATVAYWHKTPSGPASSP